MRVLVAGIDSVIEAEVIGGELLDGQSGRSDLESKFTVRATMARALPFTAGSSMENSLNPQNG